MIKVRNIKKRIEDQGINKTFLMGKLGISRRTFYKRLELEEFTTEEYEILKQFRIVS